MTTKLEGGGGVRALGVEPLVEEFFCGFPKANNITYRALKG